MAEPTPLSAQQNPQQYGEYSVDPIIDIPEPERQIDLATVLGLLSAALLIVFAIFFSKSDASFFDGPSFMITVLGTIAVTAISYTSDELKTTYEVVRQSLHRVFLSPQAMARQMVSLSIIARKRGTLSLSHYQNELENHDFLKQAIQLVVDGFQDIDTENLLQQDINTILERSRRSAAVLRRAAEIAPGMGLIGTLVGLVQMLAQLDNPSTIGPAMALALLTTFYGALMGTVILAPLAAKIERNADEEVLIKTIIMATASSIIRQENPRRLEIILNSILPTQHRIRYFD